MDIHDREVLVVIHFHVDVVDSIPLFGGVNRAYGHAVELIIFMCAD
jgi:hypothetical protein